VNVICFLAIELRRMSFNMNFLLPRPRKTNYLCIEFNLFGINLMLQLKINYKLADIIVIDMF
jgi:hypothetical protein